MSSEKPPPPSRVSSSLFLDLQTRGQIGNVFCGPVNRGKVNEKFDATSTLTRTRTHTYAYTNVTHVHLHRLVHHSTKNLRHWIGRSATRKRFSFLFFVSEIARFDSHTSTRVLFVVSRRKLSSTRNLYCMSLTTIELDRERERCRAESNRVSMYCFFLFF